MSYVVLARKYRPRHFTDLIGQTHVTRPLMNALESGRLAQAYLFAGARGVGKTTAARILAMALNCRSQGRERPCGDCPTCLRIIEGQDMDVFEIDGASNRGINEIRELRETVKYLPSQGDYKVYIIDEVHMLTKEAFNALLKTLEEPPAHVVFIFATTEAHKVLPTILSRCQRYDFKRIGVDDIVGRLEWIARAEDISIGPAPLRLIAREADGSLRDALSLFDQTIAFSGTSVSDEDVAEALGLIDRTLIKGMAEALLAGDAGQGLDILDRVYNFGHDTKDFAAQVRDYFRALLVVKISSEAARILDLLEDELVEFRQMAEGISLETLNFHFNAWLEVQESLHRSTQPRLVLEALIIRLAQVEPLQPLAEMAARLEALLGGPDQGRFRNDPGQSQAFPAPSRDRTGQPGPAPAASVPEAAPDAGKPEGRDWYSFLAMVQKKAPLRRPILEQGRAKEFGPAGVEIVFSQKGRAELVDRAVTLDLLKDFFGRRPRLKVSYSPEAAPPAEESVSGGAVGEAAREEILNHPLVKEAKQIFSGEVVEVIPEK